MSERSTIYELLKCFSSAPPDAIAFSCYDGKNISNISYSQLMKDIFRYAGFFRKNNMVRCHIALCAEISYDWYVTFLAAIVTGNIVLPLNPELPQEELERYCQESDAACLCTDDNTCSLRPDLPRVLFSDLNRNNDILSPDEAYFDSPVETMLLIITSGTTGKSKIVELSYKNIYFGLSEFAKMFLPGERLLSGFPLYHIGGPFLVGACLWAQCSVCLGRGIRYLFSDASALNPTCFALVPSMVKTLCKFLQHADNPESLHRYIGTALQKIICAGAKADPVFYDILQRLEILLLNCYGMTECCAAATAACWDEKHLETIGKPLAHTLCRIQDGELLLKGPTVMKGYYKDPTETNSVIKDGWLYTGDLVRCDEDGYYYITGRKKNVIILSNGENVNPEELEEQLLCSSDVEECLVYSNGVICADVFTHDPIETKKFIDCYNDTVPTYRQIRRVICLDHPLPKTDSGKIKRKVLK